MFSLQYEVTKSDLIDAHIAFYSRPWFKWIIIRALPGFLLVTSIAATLFFDDLFGNESELDRLYLRFELGASFLIGIAFAVLMRPHMFAKVGKNKIDKAVDKNPLNIGTRHTIVDKKGILIDRQGQAIKMQILWKDISRVYETENLFIFYFFHGKINQQTFIPKRAFESHAQLVDFKNAIMLFNRSLSAVPISFPPHSRSFGS